MTVTPATPPEGVDRPVPPAAGGSTPPGAPTPPTEPAPPAEPAAPAAPAKSSRGSRRSEARPERTRAGAIWVGVGVATLLLVALLIFVAQNTRSVTISFLWFEGQAPLAVALLAAGVGVGLVSLLIGTVRIAQLRREVAHTRRDASAG
ncbi:lipopolysaccharide assembly protein LapA domain-containing protein [Nocardioides alkalitolerans]|uniref:lipopolysaccharide assembly protein LapA domain-containing protein n=1 Tax=Nocardioides alkalitolerans TaxID=281714 RepID=UPI0003FE0D53|nr:lipopolysaccharide assembly protein LapA domain-containing protein [Nocardioides alkalitolerans]